jgi:excisionase family DNA binding protein
MPETQARRLGTIKQAAALLEVTSPTVTKYVRRGFIRAIRVGNGPYQVDLDSAEALRVEYPCASVDDRIRELVEAAPELSAKQINEIRLLLHAGGGA